MTEYTSLDISKRLAEAGFRCDDKHLLKMTEDGRGGVENIWGYRSDTLMKWLLDYGNSIEVACEDDEFKVAYWFKHEDYSDTDIALPNVLGKLVLMVFAKWKEAEHGKN